MAEVIMVGLWCDLIARRPFVSRFKYSQNHTIGPRGEIYRQVSMWRYEFNQTRHIEHGDAL